MACREPLLLPEITPGKRTSSVAAGVDPRKCKRLWVACLKGQSRLVDCLIAEHVACSVESEILQLDLNYFSEDWGGTPLTVAASLGHRNIVRSLLRAGAWPDEQEIKPAGQSARRSARLESSGYSRTTLNKNRRHCLYLVKSIRSAPRVVSVQNHPDCKSVVIRVHHPQVELLGGGIEFQVRYTEIGAPTLVPHILSFIGPSEKDQRISRLGGTFLQRPGKRCWFRCRLHSTPLKPRLRSFATSWSEWSPSESPILMPFECLAAALKTAELKAGDAYNFSAHIDEITRCGIASAAEMHQAASTPSLEKSLVQLGSLMDFHARRKLVWSLRSGDMKLDHYEFDERERRSRFGSMFEGNVTEECTKEDEPPLIGNGQKPGTQEQKAKTTEPKPVPKTILDFLIENSLPEAYEQWLLRLVDNLDQLLEAYKDKREFLQDIRENLPGMKGGHRFLLWQAICKARHASVSTCTHDLDGNTD